MLITLSRPGKLALLLLASPIAIFAAYIAWLIVPVIVSEVVPAVVQSVASSN